ncbi:hypothetical protein GCM10007301_43500 [Azorhizobium oxalatiphilum]|uniref:Uncharacterized protein n=1 Tax=Azorhizobium oxalatiphilum TaxID=980631 RepID=A0A917CAW3_9HYPH|nr:hypothetical protein GCM10007301_43500 [Azorhizobium oxalatiphilum]
MLSALLMVPASTAAVMAVMAALPVWLPFDPRSTAAVMQSAMPSPIRVSSAALAVAARAMSWLMPLA